MDYCDICRTKNNLPVGETGYSEEQCVFCRAVATYHNGDDKLSEKEQDVLDTVKHLSIIKLHRRLIAEEIRGMIMTQKAGPEYKLPWESACLTIARLVEEKGIYR